jgi:hypothetical protein
MIRNWFHRALQSSRSARAFRQRPRLEILEARTVPSFLAGVNYAAGIGPDGVATGVLTASGNTDIVTANSGNLSGTDHVSVFLGNGDGTFAPQVQYATDTSPNGVALADLTGAGILDIVSGNFNGNDISVLMGNGDGTFGPTTNFRAGTGSAAVAVGDVNGDGVPDVVTANFFANSFSVLVGNGDGTFGAPTTYAAGVNPVAIGLGDLRGIGLLDVVVVNQNRTGTGSVSIYLNNGDGTFGSPTTFTTGSFADGVAVADLNGDGFPDIVVPNALSNTVSILLNNGDGTFGPPTNITISGNNPYPSLPVVVDVNNDGFPDIAVSDQNSNQVSVLLGNGDGTFGPASSYSVGSLPLGIATGDFNGDGYADLVTANLFSNNITVLINDGVWTGPSVRTHDSNPAMVAENSSSDLNHAKGLTSVQQPDAFVDTTSASHAEALPLSPLHKEAASSSWLDTAEVAGLAL